MQTSSLTPCNTKEIIRLVKEQTDQSDYKAWKCLEQKCALKLEGQLRKMGVREKEQIGDFKNDALADLFFNIQHDKFRGESEICTYLIGIAINKWLRWLRDKQGKKELNNIFFEGDEEIQKVVKYIQGKLSGEEKERFKTELEKDTNLQEFITLIRNAMDYPGPGSIFYFSNEDLDKKSQEQQEAEGEKAKEYILKIFPPGSSCIDTLYKYYFMHEANLDRMTNAVKHPKEVWQKAYERVKKQVSRCKNKLRRN